MIVFIRAATTGNVTWQYIKELHNGVLAYYNWMQSEDPDVLCCIRVTDGENKDCHNMLPMFADNRDHKHWYRESQVMLNYITNQPIKTVPADARQRINESMASVFGTSINVSTDTHSK
jgi:hypothetical protein